MKRPTVAAYERAPMRRSVETRYLARMASFCVSICTSVNALRR